jgi:hypothetical protein
MISMSSGSVLNKNVEKKKCSFNNIITTYVTYSSEEYDRHCIDSILYQKMYLILLY